MGLTISTDAELLAASRRGEHAAFGALVERYQGVVCAVSYSRTRDQTLSEDVAQDTFLAAWRQLDQLREPSRFRAWLCGIAANLSRKARRRTEREEPIEEQQLLSGDNPFEALAAQQTNRIVIDALSRVPETYRDVLVLYYREQRSIRDVADALGITEAAATQRLARGRDHLAKGVTAVVETALRSQRAPRNLVASVLAGLAIVVPSPVEATPSSSGGSMTLKLTLFAAAVGAALTISYVVASPGSSSPPASPSPAAVVPEARSASPTPHVASAQPALPRTVVPTPNLGAPVLADPPELPEFPEFPLVEAATLTRLGLTEGPTRGLATAPVTITVFNDLSCKFCGQAYGTLQQLLEEYPTKLRVVFKQLPIRPGTKLAAEAVYAAEAQGKFAELYDAIMASQENLSRETLLALASSRGLDAAQLGAALDANTYAPSVTADVEAARELELDGTPSFVINGHRVVGYRPIAYFRAIVDAL